jgi:hypothetical protein
LDTEWSIDVSIGRKRRRFNTGASWEWGTTLDAEVGGIPVAIETWRAMDYSMGMEIKCQRTLRAREKWQQETHSALLQAYQKLRSAYEQKLAALQAQAGVQIAGRNPGANLAMVRDEMKKLCVTLLTQQHFELFNAIETGALGLPQTNLDEAAPEGVYVRFFEHAFEWENMTWVFYPYFWGRKEEWVERIHYQDVDPDFEAFLKAGWARAIVPVRPGFEPAVEHFMSTGETWNGEEPPDVTSEMWVPIVEEIRARTGAPGTETPQGEPWDVVLPTSLVYLRKDDTLPRWRKNEDTGEWEPVEETA